MTKRLIQFASWLDQDVDGALLLELVEIKIAGKSIALDQPFESNDNWLKSMTLTIKNIGKKPIVAFTVGGGLLHTDEAEPSRGTSFQHGVAWNWGKNFSPNLEKPEGPRLMPDETVELTYENVDSIYRRGLAEATEGVFCKLKFMAPGLQYDDGSAPSIVRMRFQKAL